MMTWAMPRRSSRPGSSGPHLRPIDLGHRVGVIEEPRSAYLPPHRRRRRAACAVRTDPSTWCWGNERVWAAWNRHHHLGDPSQGWWSARGAASRQRSRRARSGLSPPARPWGWWVMFFVVLVVASHASGRVGLRPWRNGLVAAAGSPRNEYPVRRKGEQADGVRRQPGRRRACRTCRRWRRRG